MTDAWGNYMGSVSDFLSDNFKHRSMGLVCDFTDEVNSVYTAVFPSKKVMEKVLINEARGAMLFVHHPSTWDIRTAPEIFHQMDRKLLERFKDRRISIFNFHVPLDNYGEYSTGVTLAKAIEVRPEKAFAPYYGALCGVLGKTDLKTVQELQKKLESTIGHRASLYKYGEDEIRNKTVAIAPGGGNEVDILKEITREDVNTFVTGITAKTTHSKKSHDFAENNEINLLGGTHYSTEKYACMAMCGYFKKLGLPSEFIEDMLILEDL
jgi:putative NIF3 family GTP cyclohydrolase 1 type 2